jgi:lysophospholipase L1-like esterase
MKYFSVLLFLLCYSKPAIEATSTTTDSHFMTHKRYTYLALGDSYTIGESVPYKMNFPNQAVSILNKESLIFEEPRIIATTGWTTDELEAGIRQANAIDPLLPGYDFVSLLIGVNNQYRGKTVESFAPEFEALLKKAIGFAGNRASRVIVLSIPDWGITPFATGRDRQQIASEIDAYNEVSRKICENNKVQYVDVTQWTREAKTDPSLLANDSLHPSGKEYMRWAEVVASFFRGKI